MFGKIFKSAGKLLGAAGPVAGFLGGPLGGAAMSALGAGFQHFSAKDAASRQMGFQRDMSNTSYQRAMEDMRLAGLNPILAYKQGGASSASGASFNPPNIGSAGVQGLASAAQVQNLFAQNDNLQQQNYNLRADERVTKENERRLKLENDAWSTLHPAARAVVMSRGGVTSAAAATLGGAGKAGFEYLKKNNPFQMLDDYIKERKGK